MAITEAQKQQAFKKNKAWVKANSGRPTEDKLKDDLAVWESALGAGQSKPWQEVMKRWIAASHRFGVGLFNGRSVPVNSHINQASAISHGGRRIYGPMDEAMAKAFLQFVMEPVLGKGIDLNKDLEQGLRACSGNPKDRNARDLCYSRTSTHDLALSATLLGMKEIKAKPLRSLEALGKRGREGQGLYQFGVDLDVRPPHGSGFDRNGCEKGGCGHLLIGVKKFPNGQFGIFMGVESGRPALTASEVAQAVVPKLDMGLPRTPIGEIHQFGKEGKYSVTLTDLKFPKAKHMEGADSNLPVKNRMIGGLPSTAEEFEQFVSDYHAQKPGAAYSAGMLKVRPKMPDKLVKMGVEVFEDPKAADLLQKVGSEVGGSSRPVPNLEAVTGDEQGDAAVVTASQEAADLVGSTVAPSGSQGREVSAPGAIENTTESTAGEAGAAATGHTKTATKVVLRGDTSKQQTSGMSFEDYLVTLQTEGVISSYAKQDGGKYLLGLPETAQADGSKVAHEMTYDNTLEQGVRCAISAKCTEPAYAFLCKVAQREGYDEIDISDYPEDWQKACIAHFQANGMENVTFITAPEESLRCKIYDHAARAAEQRKGYGV